MFAASRHQYILTQLRNRGSISVATLKSELQTNAMTVWRDLKTLDELGLLRRVHGGACLVGHFSGEPDFEVKNLSAGETKKRIAMLAAKRFVRTGDVVALEGGTTVAALVDHLPEAHISILTNSLPIALHARSARPQCPVQIAGGWISQISGNTYGPDTVRTIEKWKASVCFISATAFDEEIGPSDPNPLEVEAKRALASRSRTVVMLLDSSKFGLRSAAATLHPRRIDILITDARPPASIRALLKKNGVRLLVT